ncbi:ABC transporter permease [Nocardioides zeae]|uniref:Spermidine/putrescine transport system permease protein n=1 Tax=Nocardioides zeae TaxID=1457234 RepID=A0AAJ1U7Q9_9ACTN|nr:ABC transporter permease [Nocardioides zeae]MDQ1105707.1 putative spermidine/putrescine transport system permease protein [Nocardioides zeae]
MIRDKKVAWFAMLPALVIFVIWYVIPVGKFFALSFTGYAGPALTDGQATLATYTGILTDPYYLAVIRRTVVLGVVVAGAAVLLGYPLAYLIVFSRRWGTFVFLVTVSTMFVNPVASALGLRVMLTDSGMLNEALTGAGLVDSPVTFIGSFSGVAIGLVHAIIPFMVLSLVPILDSVPKDCIAAARGLGASRRYTFTRVIFPISVRGLLPAFLLAFAVTGGSFTTVVLLGAGRVGVLSLLIWQQTLKNLDYAASAALSVILVAVILVPVAAGIWYANRMRRRLGHE